MAPILTLLDQNVRVTELLPLVTRIQDSIRRAAPRGRDSEQIGPFLATYNGNTANPYLNYAVPDDGARPSAGDVDALVAAYHARDRKPRLEYVPLVAPAVEPVLVDAGFEVEGRLPLMTCLEARLWEPEGIELVEPSTEEEFRGAAEVQWESYEERDSMTQRAVDGLRRTLADGGVIVLARDTETQEVAGAGLCVAPEDGVTELTSIAVRESFRRRGIAAAMAGWLAHAAFAKGMSLVFLMAMGEPEARIYARAGFLQRSEVLHISLSD
jgi:ribosomal protein S18 acetylase RimI-like enzyme